MTELSKATPEEIQADLLRRLKANDAATHPRPTPLPSPSFSMLIEATEFGINLAERQGYIDRKFEGCVFEVAMTVIYGPAYFAWSRSRET